MPTAPCKVRDGLAGSGSERDSVLMEPAEPRRPSLLRVARMAAGFALLPVGVVLIPLPGPGIPIVMGGLFLLETEFRWAGRARGRLEAAARRGADWASARVRERRDQRSNNSG